tara:strand:- start:616 stop:2037 length:1422 start_codon:yes stop_codon:yes gene_type:complete
MEEICIMWFRQDLRLNDNPAIIEANNSGLKILPVYILDDINSSNWKIGSASRWWLNESLKKLNDSLNHNLCFMSGDSIKCLNNLISTYNVKSVYFNKCYEPWRIQSDEKIINFLSNKDINTFQLNGSLLFEPESTVKEDGTPYKVFTPFYRKGCLQNSPEPRIPLEKPKNIKFLKHVELQLEELELLPKKNWYKDFKDDWSPGENGAREKLNQFLQLGIHNYKDGRNFPSKKNVSRLSPHLHHGEISPNTVWYEVKEKAETMDSYRDGDHYLSELGWREFSYNLLYFFPYLPKENLQKKFDNFPWEENNESLIKWQKGETGYPIVDAGMRELWKTGYLHNRVRMIVGSFLVKNLLLHWHHGQEWFWETLVDADLANNSASWQWVSGSGADAAPYFRIFNPVTQGEKFDPNGEYIKHHIPELKNLNGKFLYAPWEAPESVLEAAGIELGKNYPKPIVDLKLSREKALAAFEELK